MAITMRKMLEQIKKEIDENPGLLDAPCFSRHSASGVLEAVYSPYLTEADDEDEDLTSGDAKEGEMYWSFPIDH